MASQVVNWLEPRVLHARLVEDGIVANSDNRSACAEVTGLPDCCRLHDVLVQAWSPGAVRSVLLRQWLVWQQVLRAAIALAELRRYPAPISPLIGTRNAFAPTLKPTPSR